MHNKIKGSPFSLTFIIRYFEDQKIVPVKVELDSKEQTEYVTVLDAKSSWIPVSLHDFKKGKVAYKDSNNSHCFIADFKQETLEDDRKRLQQLNAGVVKGFYIPTFYILREVDNATNTLLEFGARIIEFCSGSSLSYVSKRNPLLNRKKRQVPNVTGNGQKGQFTHQSYGHYGHQSNNYAHYGHDTRITGTIDKDGTLKDQKMSQYQERSQGSQTLPIAGLGNGQQIQTNGRVQPHYASFSTPNNFIGNMDQQAGTGNSGQFSLQSGHESGYRLNLPFGLTSGNTYRSAIGSRGQYDSGRIYPHQIYDHKTISTGRKAEGHPGLISPDLSQTGYPASSASSRTPSFGQGVGAEHKFFSQGVPITSDGHQRVSGSTQSTGSWPHSIGSGSHPPSQTGIPSRTYVPGQVTEDTSTKDIFRTGLSGQNGGIIPGQLSGLQPGLRTSGYPHEILSGSETHTERSSGHQPSVQPGSAIPGYQAGVQTDISTSRMQPGHFVPQSPPDLQSKLDIRGARSQPGSTVGGLYPGSTAVEHQPGLKPEATISGYRPVTHTGSVPFGHIPGSQLGSITPGLQYGVPSGLTMTGYRPESPASTYQPGTQSGQFTGGYEPSLQPRTIMNGIYTDKQPGLIMTPHQPSSQSRSPATGISSGREPSSFITGQQPDTQSGLTGDRRQIRTQPGTFQEGYPHVAQPASVRDKFLPDAQTIAQPSGRGAQTGSIPTSQISHDSQRRLTGSYPDGLARFPTSPSLPGDGQQGTFDTQFRGQQIDRSGRVGARTLPTGISGQYRPVQTIQGRPVAYENGDSASSQTQIQTGAEGTAAEASSAGKYRGLGSQTQVQGGYAGNGSFSAQAQSGFTGGVSQSQVQGGKHGGLSGSSATVENLGSAQSQVQIGKPSGSASSSAQGRFSQGMTQVNAQSSRSGGSAGAESQSRGLSSSQVHVNIAGEETGGQNGFQGTVSASVHGGHSSGQTQTQLQGGYNSGRTYVATAQGGFDSSADFQGSVPSSGSLPVVEGGRSNIFTPSTVRRNGNLSQISAMPISGISPQFPVIQNGSVLTPGLADRTRTSTIPDSSSLRHTRNGQIISPNGDTRFDQRSSFHPPLRLEDQMRDRVPHRQIHDQRTPSGISFPSPPHLSKLIPDQHGQGQIDHQTPDAQRSFVTSPEVSPRYRDIYPSLQQPDAGIPGHSTVIQPPQGYLPQKSQNRTGLLQPSTRTDLRTIPLRVQTQEKYQPSALYPPSPTSSQTEFRNSFPGVMHPSQTSFHTPTHQRVMPPSMETGISQPTHMTGSFQPSPYFPGSETGLSPDITGLSGRDYSRPIGIPDSATTQNGHPAVFPGSRRPSPPSDQISAHQTDLMPPTSQNGYQQPSYLPDSFQPPSHFPSSVTGESPGSIRQISEPKAGYPQPSSITHDSSASRNGQDRIPSGSTDGQAPHSVQRSRSQDQDKENCCDALANLKKRCCGSPSSRQNGGCCSSGKDFTTDFSDDISDENNNGESCKVVKAICYIVYKPVGKARICKPTTTNGC